MAVSRRLLINCRKDERRVALIESGVTTELFLERTGSLSLVGNIYKGRVVRVLPGMQAAFVEIGLPRTAFLFVGDVARPWSGGEEPALDDGAEPGERYPPIATLLRVGQDLLVQVSKEPIGTKGARITVHVGLPGRYLVFLPGVEHLGISRQIADPAERDRLRVIAEALKPEGGGLIVRTVGAGLEEEDFRDDLEFLLQLWGDLERRAAEVSAPALVHGDLDVTLRSVRDLLRGEYDRVTVDSAEEAERIRLFVQHSMPAFEGAVELYDGAEPMFEHYGLEWEISRAMRRKVWLRSGGSIIIDSTEALTAIDVNSGRNVGRTNFEETILEVNLEAVREIAYQLRLRDIGGLIVIDFIDMASPKSRERVHESLVAALAADKSRTHVLPMSELGLIEMTRKRARDSIVQSLTQACPYCEGTGVLRSLRVIADAILSRVRELVRGAGADAVRVTAHPRVTETLVEERQEALAELERDHRVDISVRADESFHLEQYDVR